MQRIKRDYGNSALYVPEGSGSSSHTNGSDPAHRLMNLFGGCLDHYSSYSWGVIEQITEIIYGTNETGNQRQDWLNSKYIIMWSWNPAEMRDGTNSDFLIKILWREYSN